LPDGTAVCGLIQRLTRANSQIDARVHRQACESCLQRPPAGPGRINVVVASLLHRAVVAVRAVDSHVDFESAELQFLKTYAAKQLDVVAPDGSRSDGRANQEITAGN